MDQEGSVTMLAIKRSTDVALEFNRRNSLHAGKELPTLTLKSRADITRSLTQECQWPTEKTDVLQFFC